MVNDNGSKIIKNIFSKFYYRLLDRKWINLGIKVFIIEDRINDIISAFNEKNIINILEIYNECIEFIILLIILINPK